MKKLYILFVFLVFLITTQAQNQSDFDELAGFFNEIDLTIPNTTYSFVDEGDLYVLEVLLLPERTQSNTLDKILIFADSTLYSLYEYPIRRYAYDIYNVYGCEIKMIVIKGETCVDVKNIILSNSNDLDGVVFIGNIEPAWYEAYDVINHNTFTSWPCDMFFMDLDDVWIDNTHNKFYDNYTGDFNPEIFVGRIYTKFVGNESNELELFEKYMDKNHAFWIGHRQLNKKHALSYTNASWNDSQNDLINGIQYLYGQNKYEAITSDTVVFCANDYLERLKNEKYEFIQLASHSYSYSHIFDSLVPRPNSNVYDTLHVNISSSTINNNGVEALGVNLFCCSACNWYSYAYLGGNYVYGPKSSVLSLIGSTKVGSMLDMPSFYQPLHNEKTMGQSFVDWWLTNYYRIMTKNKKICWFFGLTIIGDPLVNFFHCTNSTCQSLITLNSYDSTSSPLSYYLASDKITVAPSANYTIPLGDHCILNAPTVEIHGEFLCPKGSSMEVLNEGCKENCDE